MDGGFLVKKLLRKYISIVLMAFILINCIPINAYAGFSDIPANAAYSDALNRLVSLGIIADSENFNPDALLTREQFAKIIVVAAGLENTAVSMNGSTIFPDIAANAWSSGYINVAVNKGYITGWYDGKFRPAEPITAAQICTSLIKALGYTYQDMTGEWPDNYIIKAAELGLTNGISLNKNAGVPRWAAIMMVDRLLNTHMKGSIAAAGQTFIDSTGYYIKCTVFGDSSTLDYLQEGQILTDKGTYNNPSNIKLELGTENYIAVKNGNILRAAALTSALNISVEQVTENRVSYKVGDIEQRLQLPTNITYYYQGQKIDYAKIADILQKSASIVFNYTADKTGYSFAVIFDPVYSEPEIADNFVSSSSRLGSINFSDNPLTIRDGEFIDISQIEENDIIYQVTDIWGTNKYIVAVDNKVGGKITAVTPSRLSPKTLQIDNVNYDFSKDIDLSKISAYNIDLSSGNNIVVYLGYDGKIVNVEGFGTQDNSDYAVVLNNGYSITTDLNGLKKYIYTAKLLFSDGVKATYTVTSDASTMKGKLVKYTFSDSDTISLEQIPYNFLGDTYVKKDERLMGESYVTDNVKIFDVLYSDSGAEVTANILKWSDLPGGTIPNGKIRYTNTTGAFNDINVIFTDDILNQRYKSGIIKAVNIVPSTKGSSFVYAVIIDGSEYTFNEYHAEITIGSICEFKMNNKGIESLVQVIYSAATSTNIQAVDARRIKINNSVYFFNNNISVYYRDSNGLITTVTLSNIDVFRTYKKVDLYPGIRNNNNNRIDIILLSE